MLVSAHGYIRDNLSLLFGENPCWYWCMYILGIIINVDGKEPGSSMGIQTSRHILMCDELDIP